ncbi:hypothetical protein BDW68DRAFT_182930 [Aspergillus falconensis]
MDKVLLEHNADVHAVATNAQNWFTEEPKVQCGPPLLAAAEQGKDEMVKSLLGHGADVNHKQFGSKTGSSRYLAGGADRESQLPRHGIALHIAASSGDTELIEMSLKRGADIHANRADGCTALSLVRELFRLLGFSRNSNTA